jgi:hypothetical protein
VEAPQVRNQLNALHSNLRFLVEQGQGGTLLGAHVTQQMTTLIQEAKPLLAGQQHPMVPARPGENLSMVEADETRVTVTDALVLVGMVLAGLA